MGAYGTEEEVEVEEEVEEEVEVDLKRKDDITRKRSLRKRARGARKTAAQSAATRVRARSRQK